MFVSILHITSKGILDSVSKHLLGRLPNQLVDTLLATAWEPILDSVSKSMPKLFHSKTIVKNEIHKGLRPKTIRKYFML